VGSPSRRRFGAVDSISGMLGSRVGVVRLPHGFEARLDPSFDKTWRPGEVELVGWTCRSAPANRFPAYGELITVRWSMPGRRCGTGTATVHCGFELSRRPTRAASALGHRRCVLLVGELPGDWHGENAPPAGRYQFSWRGSSAVNATDSANRRSNPARVSRSASSQPSTTAASQAMRVVTA
jgi:hypothetical protein